MCSCQGLFVLLYKHLSALVQLVLNAREAMAETVGRGGTLKREGAKES